MSSKHDVVWDLSRHTAAKHAILRRYLDAWFPILTSWRHRVLVIDGFAGPGEYTKSEPGSPQIMIDAAANHKANLSSSEIIYIFIESDKPKFDRLQQVVSRKRDSNEIPPNMKIRTIHGEFADYSSKIFEALGSKSLPPAFVMVDPFGTKGVPLDIVAKFIKQPQCDVLISLMTESMVRWLRSTELEPHLIKLFGADDWKEAASQPSGERAQFLCDLYVKKLTLSGAKFPRTFEMKDERNHTEYYLVFTTDSIAGLRAMKAAMWAVDPSGQFKFSDTTNPQQMTLFASTPNYKQLQEEILQRYGGKEVSVSDLEDFIIAETAFLDTHYKRQILKPMESEGKLTIVKTPRKRKFSYPPGTVIRFG